jgi:hypothetical protein
MIGCSSSSRRSASWKQRHAAGVLSGSAPASSISSSYRLLPQFVLLVVVGAASEEHVQERVGGPRNRGPSPARAMSKSVFVTLSR